MADDQRVYLDDIYASEECQGSVFRAVVMMAKAARVINEQASNGTTIITKKPTTVAMNRFKSGDLTIGEKKSNVVSESNEAEVTAENVAAVSSAADDSFGF